VSATSGWRSSPDVVASRVGDEVVLVDLATDEVLVLNRTAARIWELVAAGHDRDQVRARLLLEFAVEPAQLDRELDGLVRLLDARRLVRRACCPGDEPPGPGAPS
jgi:hypothetical protein